MHYLKWAGIGLGGIVLILAGLFAWSRFQRPDVPEIVGGTDRILVEKAAHRMTLFNGGQVVRTYEIALGRGGLAPKQRQGDNLVPEGTYRIVSRNPRSAYHLALRIGYPTAEQAEAAARQGIDPGGDIMIHGVPNGMGLVGRMPGDWTAGCIGLSDAQIEEVWRLVPDGTVIEIRP